jgi:hypothetical protein
MYIIILLLAVFFSRIAEEYNYKWIGNYVINKIYCKSYIILLQIIDVYTHALKDIILISIYI